MSVSTSSIFHYTRTIHNLISIINDESFRLKYCSETIEFNSTKISIAVPMVSFCDIPFTSVSDLTKEYGNFGIGMKKDWARRKGINPIFYIDNRSYMANSMMELSHVLSIYLDKTQQNDDSSTFDNNAFSYLNLLRNTKNCTGNLRIKNGAKIINNYEFYKEREWRFLPDRFALESVYSENEYINRKDAINQVANKELLYFSNEDISYIILEKNSQLDYISKRIHRNVSPEFYSKVITLEQIEKDF